MSLLGEKLQALADSLEGAKVQVQDIKSLVESGDKIYSEAELQAKLAEELSKLAAAKDAEIAQLKADHLASIESMKASLLAMYEQGIAAEASFDAEFKAALQPNPIP